MGGASLGGLQEHLKLAREYALEGLYDTSIIFFDGAIAQINKYFLSLSLSLSLSLEFSHFLGFGLVILDFLGKCRCLVTRKCSHLILGFSLILAVKFFFSWEEDV